MSKLVDDLKDLARAKDNVPAYAGKLLRTVEDEINSFSKSASQIAEVILEEPEATRMATAIAMHWVAFWADEGKSHVDGRNEIAVDRCEKVNAMQDLTNEIRDGFCQYGSLWKNAAAFVRESPRMHKTLMQKFTSTLLFILTQHKTAGAKIDTEMLVTCGYSNWWRLPLI